MGSLSPLRYPGGKSRAVKTILELIPSDTKSLMSPFIGGGSIELAAANQGIRVFGYDLYEPLANFWQCALNNAEKIADIVWSYHPLPKEKFYKMQKNLHKNPDLDKWDKAAWFFILNRSSFSGCTMSGGMSPGHPRFNESAVLRLKSLSIENISVKRGGFENTIKRHKSDFLYCDPPYMIESNLYGNKGDCHKDFNHEGLANILNARGRWILSYNDCKTVRDLYKHHTILCPKWSYGMNSSKKSNEVLIVSNDVKI